MNVLYPDSVVMLADVNFSVHLNHTALFSSVGDEPISAFAIVGSHKIYDNELFAATGAQCKMRAPF